MLDLLVCSGVIVSIGVVLRVGDGVTLFNAIRSERRGQLEEDNPVNGGRRHAGQ